MSVDSLQSLLSSLKSSGSGSAPGKWDSTMGGTGWGGLSDAVRNSDPLYYGTQTIRDRNGVTTTPDLLAAALKSNPGDIPKDLYDAYVGQDASGQPQVKVTSGGQGLPSDLQQYAYNPSASGTGTGPTPDAGIGTGMSLTGNTSTMDPGGNDFLSLLKKYMGGGTNSFGLMS